MTRRLAWPVLALLALLSMAATGCGDGADAETDKIRVVTSIELFAEFVRNVGGERVEVVALVPGQADPHTYEPVPSQVAKIVQANLVVTNGLGLEATLEDLIHDNVGDTPVVQMAAGLPTIAGERGGDGHAHEGGNPHLWLNVQYAMRYVEAIRDALIQVDPQGAATYEANAGAYLDELSALDREIEAATAALSPQQRKLVTFHDAYPYFAERYGLEVIGVVEEAPGREPSARELARLSDRIRDERITTVYKEPEFDARMLAAAAEDAGAKIKTLLNATFQEGVRSYVDLMRFNVRQLMEGAQ